MSKTIVDYKNAMKRRGISAEKEFSGNQRSIEFLGFVEGDVFTVPTSFEVYNQSFGRSDNANSAQFIYVDVTSKAGKKSIKQLFPSSFNKSVEIYEKTPAGQPLKSTGERETAEGTACDLFRKFVTVQEGMEALAGKTIKVEKVKEAITKRYGEESLYMAQVPVMNLVD